MKLGNKKMIGSANLMATALPTGIAEEWTWRFVDSNGFGTAWFRFSHEEISYDDGSDMLPEDYDWSSGLVRVEYDEG